MQENRRRGKDEAEFELVDTGVFDDHRYFDVVAEYAKDGAQDVHIRITVHNRGPDDADLHLLPTLWFRNTWSWGRSGEKFPPPPSIRARDAMSVIAEHETLGRFVLESDRASSGVEPVWLFTGNDTNAVRLYGGENTTPHVKDAFHDDVVRHDHAAVNPAGAGTKVAALYRLTVPSGGRTSVRLRLRPDPDRDDAPFSPDFDATFEHRIREADAFYESRIPATLTADEAAVSRQAYAGLLWSKQFYHYAVTEWLDGDPAQPAPPASRKHGRNAEWLHLYNADVISMPDAWEYPWYAAWDLAFHALPLARIDSAFAKDQLLLLLREWYMHPNGQIPAYEFAFGDVNPPVHAWAVWRVYKMSGARGERDLLFLERAFHKLMLNFTWWVNRKDPEGHNLFGGGFLGLDNIGVFDRSQPLPTGGHLEQADGTAWMAFYCATMLSMAMELARSNPAYDDVASKFFEHFVAIADAMNSLGGDGLWDEEDGFYYDELHTDGAHIPLKVRSMVGLIPLFACEILEGETIDALPGFSKRMNWFLTNRPELSRHITTSVESNGDGTTHEHRLLSIPSRERLERVLRYLLDESEFLSPYGIRSVSKVHEQAPYVFRVGTEEFRVGYDPAESSSGLFGGNSNWRGPIWFPLNYLLIEALERYAHFYGDGLTVECPVGSGTMLTLNEVARELSMRLAKLFLPAQGGHRPVHGGDARYATEEAWSDLVLFYEYFHGDTGRGVGASHQTGWTALVTRCLETVGASRHKSRHRHPGEHGHAHGSTFDSDASHAGVPSTPALTAISNSREQ